MDTMKMIEISCQRCGTREHIYVWRCIVADQNPEAVDQLERDVLHKWKCPSCGIRYVIPYDTVYVDVHRKHVVFYSPHRPKQPNALSYRIYITSNCRALIRGFKKRACYGVNEFREKVLQLRNELDDRVVEVLKYYIRFIMSPHNPAEIYVRYDGIVIDDTDSPTISLRFVWVVDSINMHEELLTVRYEYYQMVDGSGIVQMLFPKGDKYMEVSQNYLETRISQDSSLKEQVMKDVARFSLSIREIMSRQ